MDMLKGYRTIIVSGLALIWAILPAVGIDIGAGEAANIEVGILAIVNIVMRLITTGPVPVTVGKPK